MQRERIYFCQPLSNLRRHVQKSPLYKPGAYGWVEATDPCRQLSTHVPQPSCCQTFPADYQDRTFRVLGRGDGKLFASTWPELFICEAVRIILKHEEIKSFQEVVKTTRKAHPYKSQWTASWFQDPFPYTTICTS